MDAALIDGDHNWYTVYHELQAAGRGRPRRRRAAPGDDPARRAVALRPPRPLLLAGQHPRGVPPDRTRPRGMHPGKKKLLQGGGLNPQLHNAVEEGGPRNGVMTGLEDWMAEYDGRSASSCSRSTSAWPSSSTRSASSASPSCADLLDRLEGAEGRLDAARAVRGASASRPPSSQQNVVRHPRGAARSTAATRYLDLLKGALLDEHYLENELRIEHLRRLHRATAAARRRSSCATRSG